MISPTLTRRLNALALFQAYAENALASGAAPKGLEQSFAATLQISPSLWSQIKSSRPIGDKLARQIEVLTDRPVGWLDTVHGQATPTPGERAFLDLALRTWRATNSVGRKQLRAHLKQLLQLREPALADRVGMEALTVPVQTASSTGRGKRAAAK